MPLCLLCPTGKQPFFDEIGELTNHISKAHPNEPLGSSMGHLPSQFVSGTQCCICNKKFTTPAALSDHQRAKQHFPLRSASPRRLTALEEPTNPSNTRALSPSVPAVNGSLISSELDVTKQRVVHRCSGCSVTFASLAELERHQSSHGKVPCSKCSHLSSSLSEWNDHFKQVHQKSPSNSRQSTFTPTAVLASPGSSNPAIVRPASAQSASNKIVPSTSHAKGLVACEHCKKEFKSQAALQAHTAAKHPAKHPAGAECVICHSICPSTVALEEHVDTVHSCAVCQDGILRDAPTLSDHMIEHSHPILCKRCGTRYRSEEERGLHFAAADNDHPVCVACRLGFEDDNALRAHMDSVHFPSAKSSHKPSSRRSSLEPVVEACAAPAHPQNFQCDVCQEACLSQIELDVHVVTVHSCPICHDGIYMDMKALEEHLERHRSPYACHSCDVAYPEEDELFDHYKNSANDIHPHCEKCNLGFEDDVAYNAHNEEAHPLIACDVCGSKFFDREELGRHYSTSRNHPMCKKCDIGFRNQFDYADHGASAHPECHCHLCRWNFDTPDVLQNHINHFFNHPQCQECNIRFTDANAYQYHLFTIHRPQFGDKCQSNVPEPGPNREDKIPHDNLSGTRAVDSILDSTNLASASFIPLPPGLNSYSSPSHRRFTVEPGDSSGSQSRSSTLSVEQRSPTDGQPWNATIQSLSLDASKDLKVSPEFDHSPSSTLPAIGTPLTSSVQMVRSIDMHRPFSPRPETPPLLSLSQGLIRTEVPAVERADSDSSSSFPRSPPLISPVVKLPDPNAISPTSTSSFTMTSDTESRRASPCPQTRSSSKGINDTSSVGRTTPSERTVTQLSLLVPSSIQSNGSPSNSGCPSSISPESAGISIAASMTPEYLREARAYLSLTHQVPELPSRSPSPPPALAPRSPGIASPVLSSAGLAIGGERGRRREVRFEDNILTEPAWDRQSTSSDSSLEPPVVLPRPGSSMMRMNGISKLPRFSALRRPPTRRWSNGHANHASYNGYRERDSRRTNVTTAPAPSYHCRFCYREHCEVPTTTTCGHLFCYECISTAVVKDSRCPVCEAPTLLYCLFRIDTST